MVGAFVALCAGCGQEAGKPGQAELAIHQHAGPGKLYIEKAIIEQGDELVLELGGNVEEADGLAVIVAWGYTHIAQRIEDRPVLRDLYFGEMFSYSQRNEELLELPPEDGPEELPVMFSVFRKVTDPDKGGVFEVVEKPLEPRSGPQVFRLRFREFLPRGLAQDLRAWEVDDPYRLKPVFVRLGPSPFPELKRAFEGGS